MGAAKQLHGVQVVVMETLGSVDAIVVDEHTVLVADTGDLEANLETAADALANHAIAKDLKGVT